MTAPASTRLVTSQRIELDAANFIGCLPSVGAKLKTSCEKATERPVAARF